MKIAPLRFLRDARGVAAVEFALIAPTIIALGIGLTVMTEAIMLQRRLQQMAQSVVWAAQQMATAPTAGANATLDTNTQSTLQKVALATLRASAIPSGLKLTLRRYVGTASGPVAQNLNLQTASGGTSTVSYFDIAGLGDPGVDTTDSTGIQTGDAVFAVDASLDAPVLTAVFGAGNFTLRAHLAM